MDLCQILVSPTDLRYLLHHLPLDSFLQRGSLKLLIINGEAIELVDHFKFLGQQFDVSLQEGSLTTLLFVPADKT